MCYSGVLVLRPSAECCSAAPASTLKAIQLNHSNASTRNVAAEVTKVADREPADAETECLQIPGGVSYSHRTVQ